MRAFGMAVLLGTGAAALAQAPATMDALHAADAATTRGLNDAARRETDAVARRNRAAQAAYAAELARFEAARRANDRARADALAAADAYRASRAAHERDLAAWRADRTRPAANTAIPAPAAGRSAPACRDEARTGSPLRSRVCR
ncbi:MAG: hypothetical protein ABW173_00805 [Sphingomonas sp.]